MDPELGESLREPTNGHAADGYGSDGGSGLPLIVGAYRVSTTHAASPESFR